MRVGDNVSTRVTPPAIVIGGGSANGLGIARNLGQRGIPVYCVTSNPYEVTCASRYCYGALIVPDVEGDPDLLRRVLTRLAHYVPERSVLFPTSDTAVLTLAAYRDVLGYKVNPMLAYDTGVYFIDEVGDLMAIPTLILQRQLTFRDLLHPYRATKKTFNYLSREDLSPCLIQIFQILREFVSRVT